MNLEPANIVCPACGSGNYMRHLIGKNVGYLNVKCINCNSYFNFDELSKRRIGEETAPKPMTHYDLLIHKTPEEMAEKIAESIDCEVCKTMHHSESDECPSRQHQSCVDFWLDWLKQEAKNN